MARETLPVALELKFGDEGVLVRLAFLTAIDTAHPTLAQSKTGDFHG